MKSLIIIALMIIALCAAYGLFIYTQTSTNPFLKIESAGVFGDSFGILTSLFSGLAFAGIIVTVWMQRKELGLQRNELELTRAELKATLDEMKSQHLTAKLQIFENTFFQMLRLHNEIVASIDLIDKTKHITTSGRDCFTTFYKRLSAIHDKHKQDITYKNNELALIESSYRSFWKNHQHELSHYFRYLYNIFRFLRDAEQIDRLFYSRLVRAQLSDQELLMLFYNCLSPYGAEKFKPLVEEFHILNNLPHHLLLDKEHISLYDPSAFG